MSLSAAIESKLRQAFKPSRLEVANVSAAHKGHAGWREGGETHFRVAMEAAAFAGKTRLQRERAVHAVLRDELKDKIHALSLSLKAPGE